MFLKQVIIQNKNFIIRDIRFHKGINLIVDETPLGSSKQVSGNNVGKTSVLRLVDYCFGADGKSIYQDTEFGKQPNTAIEKFLKTNDIIITVVLVDNLENPKDEVVVRKNFLSHNKKIQEVNGENLTDNKVFDKKLKEIIFKSDVENQHFAKLFLKIFEMKKIK
jgi:uncharacterized protein YydD (DUF2326 family)